MSRIYATDNFKTGSWSLSFDDLSPYYADLMIGFTNDSPVIEFNDLKFGYELRQGENIKKYGSFPPSNVRYVRSDQQYIVTERLVFESEKTYTLWLWCENDGKRFEKEFEFTTPRPAQPYDSWLWDGEKWNPPVPYPDDGNVYKWNEDLQEWETI